MRRDGSEIIHAYYRTASGQGQSTGTSDNGMLTDWSKCKNVKMTLCHCVASVLSDFITPYDQIIMCTCIPFYLQVDSFH